MTADRVGAVITILGSMVLAGSALIARRRRLGDSRWWMATAWAAIFAVLFVAGLWLDSHR